MPRTPDYSKSKIYKLQCEDGHYYFGSTKNELRIRLYDHKCDAKKHPDWRSYRHICSLGWDKVKIILVESYPCANRDELREREDYYIRQHRDDPLCLNQTRAYRTEEDNKTYRTPNKSENDRRHYQKVREERLAKVTCECGATIAGTSKSAHLKTVKHQTFLVLGQ